MPRRKVRARLSDNSMESLSNNDNVCAESDSKDCPFPAVLQQLPVSHNSVPVSSASPLYSNASVVSNVCLTDVFAASCSNDKGAYRVTLSNEIDEVKEELRRLRLREAELNRVIQGSAAFDESIKVSSQNALLFPEASVENCLVSAIRNMTLASTLPKIEVEPFDGCAADFIRFRCAFETYISPMVHSESQRLAYLTFYCKGKAKEAIKHCCLLPEDSGYKTAWKTLSDEFGRPHQVVREVTLGLFEGKQIVEGDLPGLQSFARKMRNSLLSLERFGRRADLDCTVNLIRLVNRLPQSIRVKWAERAESVISAGRDPVFEDLLEVLDKRISVMNTDFGVALIRSGYDSTDRLERRNRIAAVHSSSGNAHPRCPECNLDHSMSDCPAFLALQVNERWVMLRKHKRCFRCLKGNHVARDCFSKATCRVNGCTKQHHRLLHGNLHVDNNRTIAGDIICASRGSPDSAVQLGFIPVTICGPLGSVDTYAFLDNGSDCTIVSKSIADKLGLKGVSCNVRFSTLHGSSSLKCEKTDLTLMSIKRDFETDISDVLIMQRLPVTRVNESRMDKSMPHLDSVEFLSISDKTVGILLGCDVPEAHWSYDQRLGTPKQPFAAKSPLGWVLRGPTNSGHKVLSQVNALLTEHETVEDLCTRIYEMDFLDDGDSEEPFSSVEDELAIKLVSDSARLVNGHYQLQVPWKSPRVMLSKNYEMARQRLYALRGRLQRDTELYKRYCGVMEEHINKAYVSRCSYSSDRWFIPHHSIVNPLKPDKLRIVFDCAAQQNGVSLNKALLQGPDWTNNLAGMLLRFRRYPIAISADIKEMFLQVGLAESDRWAFSFLWWNGGDLSSNPQVYEWNVHPFGATSSPFCAAFALRKTASDNAALYGPHTVRTVMKDFYVDDLLTSVKCKTSAKNLVRELRDMLQLGGFDLTKWASNCSEILQGISCGEMTEEPKMLDCGNPYRRVLGVQWEAKEDSLRFEMKVVNKEVTRRHVLAYVASVFDPLGLIAPVLLQGKLILQDLCRERLGWDSPLEPNHVERWKNWMSDLSSLPSQKIPRCIDLNDDAPELHIFSDASESAYGAVAYVRFIQIGRVVCKFLMGKSRVAPLKMTTIPRLELTAALLAAKLKAFLLRESGVAFDTVHMWTDSAIVLHYLSNTSSRFATFVANRVRKIRDLASPKEWKHVPSDLNPADLASRISTTSSVSTLNTWLQGPQFLSLTKQHWPKELKIESLTLEGIEIKRTVTTIVSRDSIMWFEALSNRCCSWMQLLTRLVWLMRYKTYLLLKSNIRPHYLLCVGCITVSELREACLSAVKLTQMKWHSALASGTISNGELKRLKPVVKNGIIFLGGRVKSSELMILPSDSQVTCLVVRHYHTINGHSGASHVLAAVRERFWIIHGMATVKRIIHKCAKCRIALAPFCQQVMAPLPPCRVDRGTYAFRYTGIDYFGPFRVKIGRSIAKRFACLFTCMQSRAVHLEVSHDMSTDSFMMALTRFIGRRGPPEGIYSDNGSNFVGAEAELRKLIRALDRRKITDGLNIHSIEFNFGPPYSSHRGGVWERLIRSVRRVLNHVLGEQVISDEVLLTALAEAERIINDRPLVPVYDDPTEPHALRPSDLLLLRGNSGLINDDIPLQQRFTRRWRQVQHLGNLFWKRWIRQYLPTLQQTQKWLFTKRNLRVGDLVLIHKFDVPRGHWPRGVVKEVHPGLDGEIRKVTLRTASGEILRDIRSLCLLEGVSE